MAIVLRPQGKLDLVGSATLQQKIERVANLTSGSQKTWIIDLDRVNFINHFGLTTLVEARRYARKKGCRLFLRNIKAPIQTMLDIAELSQEFEILEIEPSSEEDNSQQQTSPNSKKSTLAEVSIEISNNESQEEIVDQSTSISNLQKILSTFKSRFSDKSKE